MGDGNQFFRPMPGGAGFQRHAAVFGDHMVHHLAGHGGNGADVEVRHDPGDHRAVFVGVGGGQTDEASSAFGPVGAENKVRHAAVAGHLFESRAFRVHLAVQIHLQRLVDGDEVVDLAKLRRVIHVADGTGGDGGIVVHPLV